MDAGHRPFPVVMRIGIGIPNSIPGATGPLLLDWARRADRLGFASLATIGRVAYPSFDELSVLAAAAGATERIGLFTNVLLGPTRSPVLLAKEAASVDQLSGGRFLLGVGVGGREDDFAATGVDFHNRGRRWDEALELMHRAWRGEPVAGSPKPVTPPPVNGDSVRLIIGGQSEAAIARAGRWGVGYTSGGGGPDLAARMFERVRGVWNEAGRAGQPELRALQYFALGPDSEHGRECLLDYYGPQLADMIWPSVPRDRAALDDILRRFEAIGTTEVDLMPLLASIDQVELLAENTLKASPH
jgi:alkanesulfonate monooxygenase SsuD/methylene tetrahydromethanopterin reductase-like flavin-dependent oxidoreductase (luciferase family)